MSKPFLRVWSRAETSVESYATSAEVSDIVELTVLDAESFDVDDKVTLTGTVGSASGRVYFVDYFNKLIFVNCPTHGTLGTIETIKFFANYMFYGIPRLGEVAYLEWREYLKNISGELITQPEQLQVVQWDIPVALNGIKDSCVDRTLQELMSMFEELSNKEVIVEMLDAGFIERIYGATIVSESFSVQESSDGDFETTMSFIGLYEVGV